MRWLGGSRRADRAHPLQDPTQIGPESLLRHADLARDARDWAVATALYTEYLAASPDHVEIWVQLGNAKKESGLLEQAKSAYEHAKMLDSDIADVHVQLGHVRKLMHDFVGAARSYAEALRLDPSSHVAREELHGEGLSGDFLRQGDTSREGEDWDAAVRFYGTYLQLHPERADVWVQLGHMRKESGDLPSAQQAYEHSLSLAPGDTEARLHLAHLLKRMGKAQASATQFELILKQAPWLSEPFRALSDLGRRQLALSTVYNALPPSSPTMRVERARSGALAIFTIACNNYLAQVRVFVDSARRAYPEARIFLCLAERGIDPALLYPKGCEIILASEIGVQDFNSFAFRYDVLEFSTALKPTAFTFLLDHLGFDDAIYFDPDIEIFSRSDGILESLSRGANFVLTPHLCVPAGSRGEPDDLNIMRVGAYNLGFVAAKRTPETLDVVRWWASHLQYTCFNQIERGLFVDQKFMDLLPGLVDSVSICRSPATNVAYWNLSERKLSLSDRGTLVDGRPLEFFHFSGFDPLSPGRLSRHTSLFADGSDAVLDRLMSGYARKLLKSGIESSGKIPYSYGSFKSGLQISRYVRRYFAEHHLTWPTDPHASFDEELLSAENPSACMDGAILTKLGRFIWEHEPYLRETFPRTSAGVDGLAGWFEAHAVDHLELDPRIVDRIVDRMRARSSPRVAGQQPGGPRPTLLMPLVTGSAQVSVIGYFRHASGVGENSRRLVDSLLLAGYRVEACDVSTSLDLPLALPVGVQSVVAPGAPVEIYGVNADEILNVTRRIGREAPGEAHRILVPSWELEKFPAEWVPNLAAVDEIWAPSRFIERALSAVTAIPVRHIPHRHDFEPRPPAHGREHFGIEPDAYVVYTAFDFLSYATRKNPEGAILAFCRAAAMDVDFAARATLVLKSMNGSSAPGRAAALRRETAMLPQVIAIETKLPSGLNEDLMAHADCIISLHRAEGLGLLIADAMARQIPVIATNYSATTELLSEQTGFPVPYHLVPIGEGEYPLSRGAFWANPDVDAAASQLLRAFHDPAHSAQLCRNAKRRLATEYGGSSVAKALKDAIGDLRGKRPRLGRPV